MTKEEDSNMGTCVPINKTIDYEELYWKMADRFDRVWDITMKNFDRIDDLQDRLDNPPMKAKEKKMRRKVKCDISEVAMLIERFIYAVEQREGYSGPPECLEENYTEVNKEVQSLKESLLGLKDELYYIEDKDDS